MIDALSTTISYRMEHISKLDFRRVDAANDGESSTRPVFTWQLFSRTYHARYAADDGILTIIAKDATTWQRAQKLIRVIRTAGRHDDTRGCSITVQRNAIISVNDVESEKILLRA